MEKLSSNGLPGARKFGDRSKAKKANAGLGGPSGRGCRDESQREWMGHHLYLQTSSSQKTSIFVIPDLNPPYFHSLLSEKNLHIWTWTWQWSSSRWYVPGTVHKFLAYFKSEMLAVFTLEYPFFLKTKQNKTLKWKDPTVPDLWYILNCIPFCSLCCEVV